MALNHANQMGWYRVCFQLSETEPASLRAGAGRGTDVIITAVPGFPLSLGAYCHSVWFGGPDTYNSAANCGRVTS